MSGTFPGAPGAKPPRGLRSALTDESATVQALLDELRGCERCPQLVASRTGVVPGAGALDARVLVVADAPGAREDELGIPLAGGPARVLLELFDAVGVPASDVFTTTLVKCHPPGNRDPSPGELARCRSWLDAQVAAIRPRVVCTLGVAAARVVTQTSPRGSDGGQLGSAHEEGAIVMGGRSVHLLQLTHPIAATYTASLRASIERQVARLPELLGAPLPEPPAERPSHSDEGERGGPDDGQLGLF